MRRAALPAVALAAALVVGLISAPAPAAEVEAAAAEVPAAEEVAPEGAAAEGEAEAMAAAVEEQVLAEREEALRTGDADRWLATVDPQAPPLLVDAERRAFEGWRSLPLGAFELTVALDDVGDLAPAMGRRLDRYGADTFLPVTERRYRVESYDERDAVDYLWWTYVERNGRWYVGGDADLDFLGLQSSKTLWELGPVVTESSDHFLMIASPSKAARASELLGIAEEAWADLDQRWDREWSGRMPVVVPDSIPTLERILQSTFDLSNFVAFVAYDTVRDEGYETTAPRMYVQDENLSRHSRSFQLDTLVHELVHGATAHLSGPHQEPWVHEGLAEWVTNARHEQSAVPSGSDGHLPEPHEFRIGGQRSILTAYAESESFVAHLSRTAGKAAPVDFFETLGARRSHPGSADFNAGVALAEVLGRDLAELESDWAG